MIRDEAYIVELRHEVEGVLSSFIGEFAAAGGHVALRQSMEHACLPAGKLVRPAMVLAAGDVFGLRPDTAVQLGIALELGHAASLVHDDILDVDDLRRGRASVWAEYGLNHALLTGDALFFAMFQALARSSLPAAATVEAVAMVASMGRDLCAGEVLQAAAAENRDLAYSTYLRVVNLKTASLLRACVLLPGAGTHDDHLRSALSGFASRLGVAFQMQDDLLPFVSDARMAGKGDERDVAGEVVSFPFVVAATYGSDAVRLRLEAALELVDRRRRTAELAAVVTEPELLCTASELIERQLSAAEQCLETVPDSRGRRFLTGLSGELRGRLR